MKFLNIMIPLIYTRLIVCVTQNLVYSKDYTYYILTIIVFI